MWPFKRETREDDVTARLVAQLEADAGGANVAAGIAAVEVATGLWGRAFASARVEPENDRTAALTPALLSMIGRSLVSPGETVMEITMDGGELVLAPAGTWSITGGPLRSSWTYQTTLAGPSGVYTRTLTGDRVLHIQYSFEASRPWDGRGPLQSSSTTVALARMLELRLLQEAGARVGTLLPVPSVDAGLQGDINGLSGKAVLVRSTSGNYDMGGPAPRGDFEPRRLGANPPPTLNELRGSLAEHVLAACGVPVAALGRADGTLARETWRQFLHGSVEPVARIAAEEIGRKLDVDGLTFKFDALRASDVQGRARAFAGMVGAGLSVDDAARIAGLIDDGE